MPFEGEGADSSRISFTALELIFNKQFGPGAVENRLGGIFKKALMEEVRPTPATMDPVLVLAAFFYHGSDPAILLDGGGAEVAGLIG